MQAITTSFAMNTITGTKDNSGKILDAALARFHKDWGGDKDPMVIAKELRQSPVMVREVVTW